MSDRSGKKEGDGGQKPSEPPQPVSGERPNDIQAIANRDNSSPLTEGEAPGEKSNEPKDEDDQP